MSSVLVALKVKASPERAFTAFTSEIDRWWQPSEFFRFTPRSPGRLAFETGLGGRFTEALPNGHVFEIGRITAWEPFSRFAFTWRQASFRPDQTTRVEVQFETVGEETRVTVRHDGWDSVPLDNAARHGFAPHLFMRRLGEFWRGELASLARSPP